MEMGGVEPPSELDWPRRAAGIDGFKPSTDCLEGSCSILLSYIPEQGESLRQRLTTRRLMLKQVSLVLRCGARALFI